MSTEQEKQSRLRAEEELRLREQADFSMRLITGTPHPVVVVEPDGAVRYVNPAFESLTGFSSSEVLGIRYPRPWWDEGYRREIGKTMEKLMQGKEASRDEVPIRTKSGEQRWVDVASTPIERDGVVEFMLINWTDVTDRRRAEETIRRQSEDILELSTPVMQVWRGILLAPLVGSFDSHRAEQFTERVLHGISETSSEIVLVDITGVPAVDTQTAQNLIDTMTAARLLGTEVVLTGVRPAIAQTLVHLGIDLSGIVTRSSLSTGLQYALNKTGQSRS